MINSILYFIAFAVIQVTVSLGATMVCKMWFPDITETSSTLLLIASAISSVLTIALFWACKWFRGNRDYIRTRPWTTLLWAALLGSGSILPLARLEEFIPQSWKTDLIGDELFGMLQTPEGYFVICMLAPLAEEIVFRGAMIKAMTAWCEKRGIMGWRKEWIAIGLSAALFAVVHFNPAQIPHALIMGVLFAWLFVKTQSIVPAFIIHWINNSSAYVFVKLYPNIPMDAPLVDYFHGNERTLMLAVIYSLMIALPSLYQLIRINRKK